jgi:hypothetical protein
MSEQVPRNDREQGAENRTNDGVDSEGERTLDNIVEAYARD